MYGWNSVNKFNPLPKSNKLPLICSFYLLSCIVDATLTHEVEKFVSNKSLLNPDIDTSVTIFGRHSGRVNSGFIRVLKTLVF